MSTCWCGNADLSTFGNEYGKCRVCGTLVSLKGLSPEQLVVHNDETDFYGKEYWLNHQSDEWGFPDIHARARNDLTERNLHWLKALLKYRLPPADVLELGCAHGSFVAMLQQAGYGASGVELSPWVVEFGQRTFGVPIFLGPVENVDIAPGSLDVIALMDVLEHLPDPVATMAHCLQLLKPDGLLLIQTPEFKEDMNYEALVKTNSAFLEQLKTDEHIYLFSNRSVIRLFRHLGADCLEFEPAIFGHYDMFFAVSRKRLQANEPRQLDTALLATPNGRLILALLDLRGRELDLARRYEELGTHGKARGEQIESLTVTLKESEADRSARAEQIESLMAMVKESEVDRAARAVQIESLTASLKESDADRTARAVQIESLTALLKESDADRTARAVQIESLTASLKESDTDRTARVIQIDLLTTTLRDSEAESTARARQIESLTAELDQYKAACAARDKQIDLIKENLRCLFGRRMFRFSTRFSSWPELENLSEQSRASVD